METTLGNFSDIIMGQSPRGESYNQTGEGIPFYQGVTEFGERFVWLKTYTTEPTKIIPPNTILFSVRAPVGRVNFTRHEACIGRWNAWILSKNGETEFLFFLLQYIEKEIKNRSSGTVFDSISWKELKDIPIILPKNKEEQQVIARMLSSFDDKIELLREQNETLEKTAQTIFHEWFGKYETDDDLPEEWRVGKLGEVIENFDSKRIPIASDKRSNGIYPYYWATWINDYVEEYIFDWIYTLLWEDGSVIKENWKPFTQYVWWKIWVNNHAHVLQGKNWFSTELIKVILDRTDIAPFVNGAVQLKINQSNMNSIPVIIPDEKTLITIDNLIQPIFSKLRNNFEQIQSLSKTRDELLPRLMKGEMRIKCS